MQKVFDAIFTCTETFWFYTSLILTNASVKPIWSSQTCFCFIIHFFSFHYYILEARNIHINAFLSVFNVFLKAIIYFFIYILTQVTFISETSFWTLRMKIKVIFYWCQLILLLSINCFNYILYGCCYFIHICIVFLYY